MKAIHGWLRMEGGGVPYPLPDGEDGYKAHRHLIDVAIPTHGGYLKSAGEWYQPPWKVDTAFARELPGLARAAGQMYVVNVAPWNYDDLLVVLADPALQAIAAWELVALATERFDAPWDAISYDVPWMATADQAIVQEAFIRLLADAAHEAGLPFWLSFSALSALEQWQSPRLSEIAASADAIDYYAIWWWGTTPINRYSRIVECLDYGLSQGLIPSQTYLGIPIFSRYWPTTDPATHYDVTHEQAMDIACGYDIQWIESDKDGLIREKYADIGDGHLWLNDGDTVRARLALVDEYDLVGAMLFCPGLGDESAWQAIADWRRPAPKPERSRHHRPGPMGLSSSSRAAGGCLIGSDRG